VAKKVKSFFSNVLNAMVANQQSRAESYLRMHGYTKEFHRVYDKEA